MAVWQRDANVGADHLNEGEHALKISETVGSADEELDLVVDGFQARISQAVLDGIEDIVPVSLDLVRLLPDDFNARVRCPPVPTFQHDLDILRRQFQNEPQLLFELVGLEELRV